MGRPREHGTETREKLVTAAIGIIGREGVGALTVRRLAEEVGTTTRAVYTLFGDKEGLLRALYHVAADGMARHLEAVPNDLEPERELDALAAGYRAWALENPALYNFFIVGGPEMRPNEQDMAYGFRTFERLGAAIGRAAAMGMFPGRDLESVGRQLWAVVHGMTSLELAGALGDNEEAGQRWRDLLATVRVGYRQPLPAA
jgi:AcrR family transcriptional regulator